MCGSRFGGYQIGEEYTIVIIAVLTFGHNANQTFASNARLYRTVRFHIAERLLGSTLKPLFTGASDSDYEECDTVSA